MNFLSNVLLVLISAVSSAAFQVRPNELASVVATSLSMVNPNYNTESQTTTDNYVFPSVQFQQMQEQDRKSGSLRKAFNDAKTTFAVFRELEAAGLINDDEVINRDDAKRKAAEKFAAFAKRSQMELITLNGSRKAVPEVIENVLTKTAAVLGRKTGQIFGGNEPENYRD
jgi:uncharacterized protein (DUF885 family)